MLRVLRALLRVLRVLLRVLRIVQQGHDAAALFVWLEQGVCGSCDIWGGCVVDSVLRVRLLRPLFRLVWFRRFYQTEKSDLGGGL